MKGSSENLQPLIFNYISSDFYWLPSLHCGHQPKAHTGVQASEAHGAPASLRLRCHIHQLLAVPPKLGRKITVKQMLHESKTNTKQYYIITIVTRSQVFTKWNTCVKINQCKTHCIHFAHSWSPQSPVVPSPCNSSPLSWGRSPQVLWRKMEVQAIQNDAIHQ